MEYSHYTKCVFISETHVIFDFTIWRFTEIKVFEGNIIINRNLDYNLDIRQTHSAFSESEFNNEFETAINICLKRAEFIFKEI